MTPHAPDARGHIDISVPSSEAYELVSDPGKLAALAEEYRGHRWLGGATEAAVGEKFVGRNKNKMMRWTTVCTITDADPGKRFAFEVTAGPLKVARWQYDFEETTGGCRVVESTWDRRAGWFRVLAGPLTGVRDRTAHNQRNIDSTLRRMREHLERR